MDDPRFQSAAEATWLEPTDRVIGIEIDGEGLEGPYAGERLDRPGTHGFFWFAWSRFHPDTAVYGASDGRQTAAG